ncbi:hypothetical protein Nepgr_022033 [Nepenthes gracilis]|uniref:Methyltransferase type 11 domain-containing protein n=1 Tax=Nepenthes gracilis TaxID=150966 RepID=A0AAD3T126_NEPGR|nr:hypothetical protein Nepgr_022033 [Nepenthes gracilis]
MASDLFQKQGKNYSEARPDYPPELFQFIASMTPCHDLAWDVATGTGQAAKSLAEIFKKVIATDVSQDQLQYATQLPNIHYHCTPPTMSTTKLRRIITPKRSVDLVTVAQALHWFDLPKFYEQVKWALKDPNGVVTAWCYTVADVNPEVNSVFHSFNDVDCAPYSYPGRRLVRDKYRSIYFPFDPVDGLDHTGPFEFQAERVMDLDRFFVYVRSMSAYGVARERGVELLSGDVVEKLKRAWMEDGEEEKVVKFPISLRIGRVGN